MQCAKCLIHYFFFALHQFDQQFMIYNYLKSDFEKINVKIMGQLKVI